MKWFQEKLLGMSHNKHLPKLCINCPLHLKYVLTLPWEIWNDRLSHQRNNYTYILVNHWTATNTTGSYCLSKIVEHVLSHIIFTWYALNFRLQHERKRIYTLPPLTQQLFNRSKVISAVCDRPLPGTFSALPYLWAPAGMGKRVTCPPPLEML